MPASASSNRLLLISYVAAIFVSAALLFAVQPLFAKMVLPQLGGTPAVWSVAMVFFQAMLLAGYAYAHLLTRYLPGRLSVAVHIVVMIVATFALPLTIAAGWGRAPAQGEAFWLLGLFAASIGLPFFALSANGPLLQAWFARTGHPSAEDPYFLYAASNIGSFLALLAYPFAIEPFSRLGQQTGGWTIGFYILIALIAVCGVWLLRSRNELPDIAADDAAPPTWRDALIWIALRRCPFGAAYCHHRAYFDRRCCRAIPVGGAAGALSCNLRHCLPVAADPAALAGAVGCTGCNRLPRHIAGAGLRPIRSSC